MPQSRNASKSSRLDSTELGYEASRYRDPTAHDEIEAPFVGLILLKRSSTSSGKATILALIGSTALKVAAKTLHHRAVEI